MTVQGDHPELMPDFGVMMTGMGIVMLLSILLYAAAVVRRLHDRGKSGFWALMPVPFLLYSMARMPSLFGAFGERRPPDTGVFFSIFISNMLYMIALIALIVLLAGRGDPGPNRYDRAADK